jgi:hypothetical protein
MGPRALTARRTKRVDAKGADLGVAVLPCGRSEGVRATSDADEQALSEAVFAESATSSVCRCFSPIAEVVLGHDATAWFGLGAPEGTPQAIIDMLSKEVSAALRSPAVSGAAV